MSQERDTQKKNDRVKSSPPPSQMTDGDRARLSQEPSQQARYNPPYPYTRDPHLGEPDGKGGRHTNLHKAK